ncbi:tyrosine-type recombinase/integrase [Rubellimicrobium arenae]|uniref:tyrosine-type recombinase/integrase n=1 Tax=Rubellimicrobium arenae TaxID=2817372 RepID=UPI001FEE2B2F|nr:tyrosine-type recombinase/integrase [Rubellimicrobium arenae]
MRREVRGTAVKLPRVHRVTAGGKVYSYHRRTRALLPDLPESDPRFIEAWLKQEQRTPPKASKSKAAIGTIAEGCEAFLGSQSFKDLSENYRPVIRRHVERIKEQGSDGLMRDLRPEHVSSDLEPLTPAVASSRMKAWRHLGAFWKATGRTQTDPTAGVSRKRLPQTDGHKEWTRADLEAFRAHWPEGTAQRLACELLQWTGARISDAVRLGPQMVGREGLLHYIQIKTGNPAMVPWASPAFGLEDERETLRRLTAEVRALVFMLTDYGKPRSVKAASQWFSEAARKAGLEDLTAHGLRKYRMNALAEAGVPLLAMQAWVGHVTLEEVNDYTQRADRRRMMLEGGVVKPARSGRKHIAKAKP